MNLLRALFLCSIALPAVEAGASEAAPEGVSESAEIVLAVGDETPTDDAAPATAALPESLLADLSTAEVTITGAWMGPLWAGIRSGVEVAREDLASRGARAPGEALRGEPGIWVQKTSHQSGTPILRGMMGNQILHLVDGVRLNHAAFRYGPNQYLSTVDAASLTSIEALPSAGSSRWGSDALGGVVSLHSRRADTLDEEGTRAGGRILLRAGTADSERLSRQEVSASSRRLAARAGWTQHRTGALRAGRGVRLSPSGYDETAWDADIVARPAPGSVVRAAVDEVLQEDVEFWFRSRLSPDQREIARQHRQRFRVEAAVQPPGLPGWERLAVRAWGQSHDDRSRLVTRPSSPASVTTTSDEDHIRVESSGVAIEAAGRIGSGGHWEGGAEQWGDALASEAFRRTTVGGREDMMPRERPLATARMAASGAFVSFFATAKRLVFDAGARVDRVELAAEADPTPVGGPPPVLTESLRSRNSAFTYRIGAALRPLDDGRVALFVNHATSFRAPNVHDVSTFTRFDYGFEVPSPALRPERGRSVEGGVRLDLARVAASTAVHLSHYSDLIGRERGAWQGSATYQGQDVYRKVNLGRARILGWEASGEVRLPFGLALSGGAAYVQGDDLTVTTGYRTTVVNLPAGPPLRRQPPLSGRAAIVWRDAPMGWQMSDLDAAGPTELEIGVRCARRQDRWAPGDMADAGMHPDLARAVTPGWTVWHMRAVRRLGDSVSLRAQLDNVFDVPYWEHGSRMPSPGRSLTTSLEITF